MSKFGISVVTIVFGEGTDIYHGRGRWSRGATADGGRVDSRRLRDAGAGSAHDRVGGDCPVRGAWRGLRPDGTADNPGVGNCGTRSSVRGVTEINTHGGYYKSYEVASGSGSPRQQWADPGGSVCRRGGEQCIGRRRVHRASTTSSGSIRGSGAIIFDPETHRRGRAAACGGFHAGAGTRRGGGDGCSTADSTGGR